MRPLLEFEGTVLRAPRPAVLFLTHRVPYPPDKGDRIRTYHALEWLGARSAVHLACLADEPVGPGALTHLGRLCARVAVARLPGWSRHLRALDSLARGRTATEGAFWSPALADLLRRWAAATPPDAVLASASGLVPYLRMEGLRDVPAVVDFMDVDSQKWLDYAADGRGPAAWLQALEGRRLRRLERDVAAWARAILLVSEAEAVLYRQACGAGPVHAVTNGVDLDYFRPDSRSPTPDSPESCVFVGALDYRPNVDGVRWFCREVWPEVRRLRPGARLVLVGRRPVPEVRRLAAGPGVEVVGQVPDVRPYVAGAAVAVAPLRIARGVQNKVLEALAMARPVVASPQALTGLGAVPGVELRVAVTPGDWVEALVRLLGDPEERRRLGAAGRRYVEQHHRWEQCLDPLGEILLTGAGGCAAATAGEGTWAP